MRVCSAHLDETTLNDIANDTLQDHQSIKKPKQQGEADGSDELLITKTTHASQNHRVLEKQKQIVLKKSDRLENFCETRITLNSFFPNLSAIHMVSPGGEHAPTKPCFVRAPDKELLQNCRLLVSSSSQNRSTEERYQVLAKLVPPQVKIKEDETKYGSRMKNKQCETAKGMWRGIPNLRCTGLTTARRHAWKPGDIILDIGSGCGHFATMMTRLYGVRFFGIELNPTAHLWSTEHSTGIFRRADAADLSWIPSESFDHMYSFATIYYIRMEQQCSFTKEVVRVLRSGGTAMFGWLGSKWGKHLGLLRPQLYKDCLGPMQKAGLLTFSIESGRDLWQGEADGSDELDWGHFNVLITKTTHASQNHRVMA
jgi:SAM-dependent methyltransferase